MTTKNIIFLNNSRLECLSGRKNKICPIPDSNHHGFATVLFAIALVVLLGVLGLALDSGKLFITKQHLASSADAGAKRLIRFLVKGREFSEPEVQNAVKDLASSSYALSGGEGSADVSLIKNDAKKEILVEASASPDLWIMDKIFGFTKSKTTARADASAVVGDRPVAVSLLLDTGHAAFKPTDWPEPLISLNFPGSNGLKDYANYLTTQATMGFPNTTPKMEHTLDGVVSAVKMLDESSDRVAVVEASDTAYVLTDFGYGTTSGTGFNLTTVKERLYAKKLKESVPSTNAGALESEDKYTSERMMGSHNPSDGIEMAVNRLVSEPSNKPKFLVLVASGAPQIAKLQLKKTGVASSVPNSIGDKAIYYAKTVKQSHDPDGLVYLNGNSYSSEVASCPAAAAPKTIEYVRLYNAMDPAKSLDLGKDVFGIKNTPACGSWMPFDTGAEALAYCVKRERTISVPTTTYTKITTTIRVPKGTLSTSGSSRALRKLPHKIGKNSIKCVGVDCDKSSDGSEAAKGSGLTDLSASAAASLKESIKAKSAGVSSGTTSGSGTTSPGTTTSSPGTTTSPGTTSVPGTTLLSSGTPSGSTTGSASGTPSGSGSTSGTTSGSGSGETTLVTVTDWVPVTTYTSVIQVYWTLEKAGLPPHGSLGGRGFGESYVVTIADGQTDKQVRYNGYNEGSVYSSNGSCFASTLSASDLTIIGLNGNEMTTEFTPNGIRRQFYNAAISAADYARSQGIKVYTIGLGQEAQPSTVDPYQQFSGTTPLKSTNMNVENWVGKEDSWSNDDALIKPYFMRRMANDRLCVEKKDPLFPGDVGQCTSDDLVGGYFRVNNKTELDSVIKEIVRTEKLCVKNFK